MSHVRGKTTPASTNGSFAPDLRAEVGVDLAVGEDPEQFAWERIESLMGSDLHLDPQRSVSLPKINVDDDIAQMTRKVMTYAAKTQQIDDMTDEQIAVTVGLQSTDPKNVEWIRRSFKLSSDDRIVAAANEAGAVTYLSISNAFTRTGTFQGGFSTANIAHRMVIERFKERFKQAHPEFSVAEVDRLFRRLEDKSYTGKAYKGFWSENIFEPAQFQFLAAAITSDLYVQNPDITPQDVKRIIFQMEPDQVRAVLERLPQEPHTVMTSNGPKETTVYVTQLGALKFKTDVDFMEDALNGTSRQSKQGNLNRAYRKFITEELAVEYDYQLQRQYVRDSTGEHTATVFEQKKNVPSTHLDAADNSFFRTSGDFRHVEFDADVELQRAQQVADEYAQLRRYLPRTDTAPALRFRKTGRHRALGTYHPHAANIAVDPRSPSSLLHEYAHHIDHTAGKRNISSSEEFRPLLRQAQENMRKLAETDTALGSKLGYFSTPTEVHSRMAELYFHWRLPGTSLNGAADKYDAGRGDYEALKPLRAQIEAFFDDLLPKLGAEVPVSQRA